MKSPFETSAAEEEIGEGARILHALERTGNYVFHGSPSANIHELEIRQPYDWTGGVQKQDGAPCVAATRFADIAIFRALVFDDTTGFGQNDDGTLHYEATAKALKSSEGRTGFIYVLPRSEFTPRHGDDREMEWRSEARQKAIRVVEVTNRDLPKNITILPPKD